MPNKQSIKSLPDQARAFQQRIRELEARVTRLEMIHIGASVMVRDPEVLKQVEQLKRKRKG